jgi:hypothetical protein
MAVIYQHTEQAALTEAQKAKFVTFITSIWPGAVGDIEQVSAQKRGSDIECTVVGTMTVTDEVDLPDPPFSADKAGSTYTYGHDESVILTPAQRTAFIDFVQDTWSGNASDVARVAFRRITLATGVGIAAIFTGTKSVATLADLPDGPVSVAAIT